MIRLDQVVKRFETGSRVRALDGVTLNVPNGQLLSVVGPSGSGKSTLLNIIGCLDRSSSGTVLVDGESPARLSDEALTKLRRDRIGFIFQFFNLLPTLTCLENVGLPLHLRGWSSRKVRDRAAELLELVQLDDRMEHLPEQLSGGQRQRVAIARALAANPPILLADEPTGNLDSATGDEVLRLIADLHARLGATVVMVTHDRSVARRCQRSITLCDGRVVEDTSPS